MKNSGSKVKLNKLFSYQVIVKADKNYLTEKFKYAVLYDLPSRQPFIFNGA